MQSIILELYDTCGCVSLAELERLVGNKYTCWREIMWLADNYKPKLNKLDTVVRDTIVQALDDTTYQKDAAKLLGISERKLSYQVHKYGLKGNGAVR